MSWSFYGVGKPAALKREMDRQLTENYNYQGADTSKAEFEHATTHIKGLLDAAHDDAAVSVNASGHASFENGKRTYANIDVTIKQLGQIYE